MNEATETTTRPTSITVICVIGFLGGLLSIPMIFSSMAQEVGAWYPPYLGFSTIVGVACMVGLWKMRKWAAYTYTGFVVLNQVVLLEMDIWNIMALLVPVIVIFLALKNVSRMT